MITMQIRKGTENDIEEVAALYDALHDYLGSHMNYPGWRKGIYPTREDAAQGIAENNLFIAVIADKVAGTFILRHRPEEAYALADWGKQLDYSEILVLYTFAVHRAMPEKWGNLHSVRHSSGVLGNVPDSAWRQIS